MIVAIVGAGNMGRALATRALAGGHEVRLLHVQSGRAEALADDLGDPRVTAVNDVQGIGADLVVLAVPYPAGREVVTKYGDRLAGMVVVDISNPIDLATFESLATPPDVSAAEEIAAANPSARVVKAFNTTFAGTLIEGQVAGQPLDVFIAGDDAEAKDLVAELVESSGLRPMDVGPLRRARELEAFQLLHITAQGPLNLNWSSSIKILS